MTGDTTFSPPDEAMSPDPNLHITIEECSQNSGHLLEDEGDDLVNDCGQLFEIEGDDHENERDSKNDQFFDIESNGHENEGDDANEHLFDIEANSHENDRDVADEQLFDIEGNKHGDENKDDQSVIDGQSGASQRKVYSPPIVGMEFESYDDAYNYYNCYAKEIGFAIRVKSSWTKRNSKEKRGAVLCCNCEGFKMVKEANSRRKETRTGCLAMIRLRLVESNRWRVDEAKLEHNHLFDPEGAQNSKSHKRMDAGVKRKVEPTLDVEVRTIKLYRTPAVDTVCYGSPYSYKGESNNQSDWSRRLKLKDGDAQLIQNFFCRAQLADPNFFYVMDFNDEGNLRNVFWIDSRSRAAYGYFGDVVLFDTTCLLYNYEIPLVSFVGVNHHGQTILLGCGLLAVETLETYIWLFRAWLTCLSGRPPQTIITNQCKAMQTAMAEVFPRAHHRLCLGNVVQSILENLGALQDYKAFQMALFRTVYDSLKVDDFEMAWEEMIQRFGIKDYEWLRNLFEDRERWAPVYSKDTFFAGMFHFQKGESISFFFDGFMHEKISLKEFFDIHDSVLEKKRQKEALDDFQSRDLSPMLKTRCYYELQISQVYTKDLFSKFQDEIVMMSSCFNITQVHTNGSIATYMIKERDEEEMLRDVRNFEVVYDKPGAEVRCICGCFNFKGYLCRHALCILNYNGVEGIPFQYILSRWRKDFRRLYVPDLGSNNVDITNPVQWFDHLYKRAMQVVEEGMISHDHYMVAWQAFKESLNKVRLVADKNVL
ncbi:Protein FAR1-RELATED SEQUENCE 8 [Morus notabilis]|uniref:Protein FAR1-RELATED SEQUENCE n=1 Tax=Morus notabilis TaxID=981085 RepID=W9RSB0_9ROSA|nr:protein FAR1-RELATED SEQUENCE 8 isoform X1 [Morus notabilis]EXB67259.1 Protein FAR1-RELATED SEQUENCE 8 [Morus notabilis]